VNWFTGMLVFIIVWWVVFFTVLPWGVHVPDHNEPGHATSAPERPMIWRKMLITSALAAVIWGAIYYVIANGVLSLSG